MHSLEEICRQVLQQACEEGIVRFNRKAYYSTESPLELTSGDLVGVALKLRELLNQNHNARLEVAMKVGNEVANRIQKRSPSPSERL